MPEALRTFETYFLLFLAYSVIGWLLEVCNQLLTERRFVNRGFLIGPYCPIYGWGALLSTLLLQNLTPHPVLLFFVAILIYSILEYGTSFIMEKIYHARWWDYSDKRFHLHGRICLDTMIPFGLLGLLIIYVTNPILISLIARLPAAVATTVSVILLVLFLVDNIISYTALGIIRRSSPKLSSATDNTEELSARVRSFIRREARTRSTEFYEYLSSLPWRARRLVKAFPTFQPVPPSSSAKSRRAKSPRKISKSQNKPQAS